MHTPPRMALPCDAAKQPTGQLRWAPVRKPRARVLPGHTRATPALYWHAQCGRAAAPCPRRGSVRRRHPCRSAAQLGNRRRWAEADWPSVHVVARVVQIACIPHGAVVARNKRRFSAAFLRAVRGARGVWRGDAPHTCSRARVHKVGHVDTRWCTGARRATCARSAGAAAAQGRPDARTPPPPRCTRPNAA